MSYFIFIFNILIIICIIFLYFYYFYYIKKTHIILDLPFSFDINNKYDTIINHNSSTLTFDGIYKTINYYNPDIVCIFNVNFKDQIVTFESVSNYDSEPIIIDPWSNNNKLTINNSMIEFITNNVYMAVSRKKYLQTDIVVSYISNTKPVYMYIIPLKRYLDNKEFILFNIIQNLIDYTNEDLYKSIIELLLVIKNNYANKDFIINGCFNIQGYEDIFIDIFGKDTINILKCKYTVNDENGLASTSGIIISKNLYKGIEYGLDFFKGFSTNSYIIKGKLYNDKNIGLIDKTPDNLNTYLNNVIKNRNPSVPKSAYKPNFKDNIKIADKYNIKKTITNINKNSTKNPADTTPPAEGTSS